MKLAKRLSRVGTRLKSKSNTSTVFEVDDFLGSARSDLLDYLELDAKGSESQGPALSSKDAEFIEESQPSDKLEADAALRKQSVVQPSDKLEANAALREQSVMQSSDQLEADAALRVQAVVRGRISRNTLRDMAQLASDLAAEEDPEDTAEAEASCIVNSILEAVLAEAEQLPQEAAQAGDQQVSEEVAPAGGQQVSEEAARVGGETSPATRVRQLARKEAAAAERARIEAEQEKRAKSEDEHFEVYMEAKLVADLDALAPKLEQASLDVSEAKRRLRELDDLSASWHSHQSQETVGMVQRITSSQELKAITTQLVKDSGKIMREVSYVAAQDVARQVSSGYRV